MASGDLTRVGPVIRALESTLNPVARAWAMALRSQLALTAPRYGVKPRLSHLADFVDGPPLARRAAIRSLTDALRLAALAFDPERVVDLATLAPRLAPGLGESESLLTSLCAAWADYVEGDVESCGVQCNELMQKALRAKSAALVVEAQALRALATLEGGEQSEALGLARRASLAARSEGLPQPEFLAHVVLARARRHARQSHLSLRILEALRSVVTDPWRGWLCWEWLMAGGDAESAEGDLQLAGQTAVRSSGEALLALLQAATRGDSQRASESRARLESNRSFLPASRDAQVLIAASDPEVQPENAQVAAWRAGRDPLIPAALHGLRLRGDGQSDESAAAYVVRFGDGRAVRVLHWGMEQLNLPNAHRVRQSQRAQGRIETVMAVLALSEGAQMAETECFAETYGFPFVPEVHRGVFDVLLHRTRGVLGDAGEITKDGDLLRLTSVQPLVIPDPRVSQRTADRVLRLLSERGSASAKDMASSLGISLRAAQSALAELSDQGACDAQKRGRAVAYIVEDTIFSEPTARLRADQLTGLTTLGQLAGAG